MATKDLFSGQSKAYAAFRPTYPEELYSSLYERVQNFDSAWDCATGNGQVARELSKKFAEVHATDISQKQIDEAFTAPNIKYAVGAAERTTFTENTFDLVTVGQALHWFNTDEFYAEVKRVGKKGGVIAVWGYSFLSIDPAIDKLFKSFYFDQVGPYWDAARKLVEDEYSSIAFPFGNPDEAKFTINVKWSRDEFAGYLTSWSATQKFIQAHQHSPIPEFINSIDQLWKADEHKRVTFPVFLKIGTI